MNTIEWLNEIEKKADAATPGPWENTGQNGCYKRIWRVGAYAGSPAYVDCKVNADFIASANPETVKRLVLMIEHLAMLGVDGDKGDEDKQYAKNLQWSFEEADPKGWK